MMRLPLRALFCLLLPLSLPLLAQSSLEQDGYTIYFSAIPSLELTPEVARGYAITRSANRALLNIAVRRPGLAGDAAVTARISGLARNDAGQGQPLALREVREGEAIYYLAEPRMRPGDSLRFELQILPEGREQPIALRFSRTFYP
jgi:hypothetical protein